jgi:hypothetical protein
MARDKRDKWINVKVTEIERAAWQTIAQTEGVTVADAIRARMESKPVNRTRRQPRRKADPALLAWLGRLNSNLNVIAHWCNRYKSTARTVEVLQALIGIERHIREAAATHTENREDDHGG